MATQNQRTPNQDIGKENTGWVAGLFHREPDAEVAIEDLKDAGFTASEIGIATSSNYEESKPTGFWSKVKSLFGKEEHTESASSLQDSLEASGLPQQEAGHLNNSLSKGDILITVRCTGERAATARKILEENEADMGADAIAATKLPGVQGETRIQLLGEILRVQKETVSRGEVKLRKEVVTDTQNVEVPVSREELVVERIPGEGRETVSGQVGASEKEIRIPLSEERVRVEKKPVVNEEVRVGKRQVQSTQRVADTVRHEELRTESEGDIQNDELREVNDNKRRAG